ncbi:MAG: hypothetical protein ACTSRG_11410 [Candidatus Helarchaeota archaeon]
MSEKETNYEEFFENIECNILSDSNTIIADRIPIIEIQIKYIGNKSISISWDENFGRLLWEGKFVLISKWDDSSYDTSNLKFKTSNIYPPRKTVQLNKGIELISNLDFSKLPISYETKQLFHERNVCISLYVRKKDELKAIKQISNELIFHRD